MLVSFDGVMGMKYFDLIDDISLLFKIKVDVVSRRGIKPKYFAFVKSDLQYV